MRKLILIILLLMGGCTSYHNPGLSMETDRNDQFKMDRAECLKRAQKESNSAPGNDWQFLKTYDQKRMESNDESRKFERCMSGKGWIKK